MKDFIESKYFKYTLIGWIFGFYFIFCLSLFAQTTTTGAQVDEWAEIVTNATRRGATTSINTSYAYLLYIDLAQTSETAHTGTKITVYGSPEISGDQNWAEITRYISTTGTAVEEPPSNSSESGPVIEVAATAGYEADESRWIFIEDLGTVANSEMGLLISHVSNTSITLEYAMTNAKDTADRIYNIAQRQIVSIPFGIRRVYIHYDNTFDVDGSAVHTHSFISQVTGI